MERYTFEADNRARCIDCQEGLQQLRDVNVIVTSPPYNIGIKYRSYTDQNDGYLQWMEDVWKSVFHALSDQGHFFLQAGGTASNPLIPYQLVDRAIKAGLKIQNEIVWVKNISIDGQSYGHFKPLNTPRFLNHTHEYVYHLTKTGNVPINRLAIGVPFQDKSNIARFGHSSNLRCRGNTWFVPYETIQSKEEKGHPAIFPSELPKMCIQMAGIPANSIVVDPFVGSGSTLVACVQLGMKGIGFDIDPVYTQLANMRVEEEEKRIRTK